MMLMIKLEEGENFELAIDQRERFSLNVGEGKN